MIEVKNDKPDIVLKDGTPLYLKTTIPNKYGSLQLELYNMLTRYKAAIGKDVDYGQKTD
jgi:hypothetical protein